MLPPRLLTLTVVPANPSKGVSLGSQLAGSLGADLPIDLGNNADVERIAAVFQSNPGPTYNANATFTTAQVAPTLGRPLSGGVRTVTVNLVSPFSQFGPRINQFDVRLSKIVRLGGRRLQANVDLYNVFNASSVVNFNSTFGSLWLQPTQILDARLFKFSAQIDF